MTKTAIVLLVLVGMASAQRYNVVLHSRGHRYSVEFNWPRMNELKVDGQPIYWTDSRQRNPNVPGFLADGWTVKRAQECEARIMAIVLIQNNPSLEATPVCDDRLVQGTGRMDYNPDPPDTPGTITSPN